MIVIFEDRRDWQRLVFGDVAQHDLISEQLSKSHAQFLAMAEVANLCKSLTLGRASCAFYQA